MSGDSIALKENEEELDLVGILATQGENDEIDDEELDGDEPKTLEEWQERAKMLEERVSKRNRSLKKAKEAVHRAGKEKSEALALYEKLEAKLNSSERSNKGSEDLERQAREWMEKVEIDPTKAIEYADWKQSQLESKIASYLESKFSGFEQKINALMGATNPERLQYKEEIDMLKSNPQFAELDENVLLTLAKGLKSAKVKSPRGTATGSRATADKGKPFKLTDEQKAAMGFN